MHASVYHFNIGTIQCCAILDGVSHIGRQRFLRRFPDGTEADYRTAFAELGLSFDAAQSSLNVLLLKIGQERILIDAGEGQPVGGLLPANLRVAGVQPEEISQIIITHAHGDHILGLLDAAKNPVFPNARYIITGEELQAWEQRIATKTPEQAAHLEHMRVQGLRLIPMDANILPEIRAVPLAGHTPGHIGLMIESQGQRLLHLADVLHSPIQFVNPAWCAKFDQDRAQATLSRRRALSTAAMDGIHTFFYHLGFPGLGKLTQVGDAFIWHPTKMNKQDLPK